MAVRFPGVSLASLALLAMAVPAALPAAPYLVKDVNAVPFWPYAYDNSPVELSDRGSREGVWYFTAPDSAHGVELWRSDGTPGGTERLTDICAGVCSSLPAAITVHGGRVFFRANDGFSGEEPWVSDGTPGSERRLRDFCPGACGSYTSLVEEVGGRLLFFASTAGRLGLWQTDGTREGTVLVKVLCTADCSSLGDLVPIGARALFTVGGVDLWVTDGTAGGTRFLRQLGYEPFGFYPKLIPGDGLGWVWDADGLWRTDGTDAGTFLLKTIDEITKPSTFTHDLGSFVLWRGSLFAILGAGEVIRSDGTPEGTFRIASFSDDFGVAGFAPLDGELLFHVFDRLSDGSVLWSSQGTAETTAPKLVLTMEEPLALTSLGGDRAVFLAGTENSFDKTQLWVTDGTEAGTRQIAVPSTFLLDQPFFTVGDGRALFFHDGTPLGVWVTDGTDAGTREVLSFQTTRGPSGPLEQAALGGKLVFSAMTSSWTPLLFVSDGTAEGTGLLSQRATSADSFFLSGDRLLFSATRPGTFSTDLWATDGTPAGTFRVSYSGFSDPVRLGGQILFRGTSGYVGQELMKTDSLARKVELVKDIDPFIVEKIHHQCEPESSFPVFGGVVGGRMLLAADDGRSGRELWASDGTWAGTVLVRDIHPGRTSESPSLCPDPPLGPHRHDIGLSSDPQGFVILGSVTLFTADDGRSGRELWISNGTSRGTRRVADLIPGPRGSAPHDLVRLRDRVYFLAGNPGQGPGQGESLWRTDGTTRGTHRVLDLTLEGLPSWGSHLTVAAGRLFFIVYNETTGAELWASTGEAGGTGLVTDLNPGPGSSSPQFLTAVGGALLYAADDGLAGLEPWRTDGTAAGTLRVGDITPGRDGSSPGPFTALPDLVMMGADDGVHGRELWAIPRTEIEIKSEIVQPE